MRRACQITLNDADRAILERWSRGRSTPARLVIRSQLVLAAAEGKENKDIATELKISRGAVARWRDRFAKSGCQRSRGRMHRAADGRQRHAEISCNESSR